MKIWCITRKTLLELWREPLLLGLMLFFPLTLVGVYYLAFGQTNQGLASYLSIAVVNDDAGAILTDNSVRRAGTELIEAIRQAEFEGQPVFQVNLATGPRRAEITLREHKTSLVLFIPSNFTQVLLAGAAGNPPPAPATVSLVGDSGSTNFVFAQSFLNGLVRQFVQQTTGWPEVPLNIVYEFVPGTGTMSDFDFGVGGIIVFGLMFLIITTATVLVRENVTGTLRRLRLTRAKAGDLLLGVTLAQLGVAVIQIPLTFGAAVALGFHSNGSLLLAIVIGLLLTLSAVGLGLMVACFARTDGEAANLGSGVLVPMVFLSGALFPLPEVPLGAIAGHTIQLYDLLPATHASEAMRRVLIFGDGPAAIWYELTALALLSFITLGVGVRLYQKLQLRQN
jgi:ABC-2 type transport system permease protein